MDSGNGPLRPTPARLREVGPALLAVSGGDCAFQHDTHVAAFAYTNNCALTHDRAISRYPMLPRIPKTSPGVPEA